MLTPIVSGQFKRDLKRMERRGKDIAKLKTLIALLAGRQPLAAAYRDHPLKGPLAGFRDAHIEPDRLLIYRVIGDSLQLARTGTHADLFDE